MAATKVSDQLAAQIALTVSSDALQHALNIPTYGLYVVYNNHRYLLMIRDNKYQAWDISVYNADGEVYSDTYDVWFDFLADLPGTLIESTLEGSSDIGSMLPQAETVVKWLPWVLWGSAGLIAYFAFFKGKI
ncbi:hypothetical protein M0R72_17375 [Candidatus Pacearchaeota archaeon]|jgi:hypothetical protein|nr:hypothetical protein [Candidatus Pacearchaeota archaeon]